ncbi:hypothetical protein SAY86_030212 [Trapa natans]|uniref:Homeobox domain-containing protein n=1 Tax=Trapa natans TaxID=22666 RepID=A0AAN7MMP5_TRANT|nr:hypothetical protein SAY86_030212 [Trapa natans]
MSSRNCAIPDEISTSLASTFHVQRNSFSNMAGFPMIPMLQGEPISCLQDQLSVNPDLSLSSIGKSFMGSSSERSPLHELPGDILMPSAFTALFNARQENSSLNIIEASGSSLGTCGYVDVAGSSKWELCKNNVLAGPELGTGSFTFPGNLDQSGLLWVPSNPIRELSLSLATSQPSALSSVGLLDQQPGMRNSERSSTPVLFSESISSSKYLFSIQEILAQIASYALEGIEPMNYVSAGFGGGISSTFSSSCQEDFMWEPAGRVQGLEGKKTQLLRLLQVVDDRYNRCLDEIHTVISAFHAATELDTKMHTRFALQTVSFMYKSLRERISTHILSLGEHHCFDNGGSSGERERSLEVSFTQRQWSLQQLKRKEQHLWRPQRGLPDKSVSVLRAWMFQNFLHPYPKDAEKHLLALKSGLTRSQVSNWFINARVRLWKPMIEEMYAELNRRNAHCR